MPHLHRRRQTLSLHLVQDLLLTLGLPDQVSVGTAASNEVLRDHHNLAIQIVSLMRVKLDVHLYSRETDLI